MTEHIRQTDIERFALDELSTSESLRVRHHLFECESCLGRLMDLRAPIAAKKTGVKGLTVLQARAPGSRAYIY